MSNHSIHREMVNLLVSNPLMTLQDVANQYGVSREWVRQLAARAGINRKEISRTVREGIIAELDTSDDRKLAKKFRVSIDYVEKVRYETTKESVREENRSDYRERITRAVDRVKNGESMRRAAKSEGIAEATVSRYCKLHNIETTHGRWKAMSQRAEIVRTELTRLSPSTEVWPHLVRHLDFNALSNRLTSIERRVVKPKSLEIWVRGNLKKLAQN